MVVFAFSLEQFSSVHKRIPGQVSRSDTAPVLRLYLSPVRMRDIKCLNLNSHPVLRLSQYAAATATCHYVYYYFRVSIAPPLPCINV